MLICAAIRRCVRFASRSKKGQSTKFCELVFPLINAIVARQLGMVTLLLDHGASCEVSDSRGTPLAMASKDGWLKGVEVLISHCPDWASPTRRDADTGSTARGLPLNAAAAEGHVDVLRFLLRHGGDPNEKCGEGLTPLVRAAMYGQQQALQLLVIYGANPKDELLFDSREHFETRTHHRLIDVHQPTAQTIDALMGLELPAGVEIEVKL